LNKIADGIEDGSVKYLSGVKHATQLDMFNLMLRQAKRDYEANNNIDYSASQKRTVGEEDISEATIQGVVVHTDRILNFFDKAKGVVGVQKLMKQLKKAPKFSDWGVDFSNMVPELQQFIKTVYDKKKSVLSQWDYDYFLDRWDNYNRLNKLGITTNEHYRQALREYMDLSSGAGISKEELQKRQIRSEEQELARMKIPGFFPTPKPVIDKLMDEADIKSTDTVLEPSAGTGHIADAIKETGAKLTVGEYNRTLFEFLEKKGYDVKSRDFLEHNDKYDKIIMNPPFEQMQDIDHVKHAYNLLNDGGRLVSVMGAGSFLDSKAKVKNFLQWMDDVDGRIVDLPAGSFKGALADRQTGVSSKYVVIDKPVDDIVYPETKKEKVTKPKTKVLPEVKVAKKKTTKTTPVFESGSKKELLKQVNKALASAPTEGIITYVAEDDYTDAEKKELKELVEIRDRYDRQNVDAVRRITVLTKAIISARNRAKFGSVSFKIGNTNYTVLNTKTKLQEFKKRVASPPSVPTHAAIAAKSLRKASGVGGVGQSLSKPTNKRLVGEDIEY